MTAVAYAPKEAFRDPDCLGALFVNDYTDVNVRELVLASTYDDGTFVVDDPAVQAALDRYEALKRVKMPEPKAAPKASTQRGAGSGSGGGN